MGCGVRATGLMLLILGCFAAAHGQETAVMVEASAALRHFLSVDCEVGAEGTALEKLLQYANQLEPELRRILLDGPDESRQNEVRETLEAEWDRREAFLAGNPRLGLSPDDLLAVHTVQREEYLEHGAARFASVIRERAAIGLAAIGSPTALRTLHEQAGRGSGDLRKRRRRHLRRADSLSSDRPK